MIQIQPMLMQLSPRLWVAMQRIPLGVLSRLQCRCCVTVRVALNLQTSSRVHRSRASSFHLVAVLHSFLPICAGGVAHDIDGIPIMHALLFAAWKLAVAVAPGSAHQPICIQHIAHLLFSHQAQDKALDEETICRVLHSYESATHHGADSYKAWHAWALMNFMALSKQALLVFVRSD